MLYFSSKLANLFGAESQSVGDSNKSLMYTPPKQPKHQKQPSKTKTNASGIGIGIGAGAGAVAGMKSYLSSRSYFK